MCAVTLIVLADCAQELPTIKYCDEATADVKKYEEKPKCGEKVDPPRRCKTRLVEEGKRTFGGAAKATGDEAQAPDGTAAAGAGGKDVNPLQHLLKHVQRKSYHLNSLRR
ncbi:hypothetical protein B0A48_04041 [Cryoendolithus antarcticus]|uniref:Uncharacterized protein n=1 Tax=Cryoendolithus antarcticus TaxID=1507870 RepID=A0A1V8THL9_9PEZI|nr:hypothetical protein B0A48_04041 [Cryoendolithus antarcticus]